MEAGFKMEGFACFVSETSTTIYAKEQWLPKGLQELLVSRWGHTQHIPQLLGWEEPEFQLQCPRGCLLSEQPFPCSGAEIARLRLGIRNTHRFFTVMD